MTSRGRVRLYRTLCYVGAFIALALGVVSFVIVILVAGVLVAILLVLLAARLSPELTPRTDAAQPRTEGE